MEEHLRGQFASPAAVQHFSDVVLPVRWHGIRERRVDDSSIGLSIPVPPQLHV